MENVENYTVFEKTCMETAKWISNYFVMHLAQLNLRKKKFTALAINKKDFFNLFYKDFDQELFSKDYKEHYDVLVRTYLDTILMNKGYSCLTWTKGIFKKNNYIIILPSHLVKKRKKCGILKQTFSKYKVIGKIAYV